MGSKPFGNRCSGTKITMLTKITKNSSFFLFVILVGFVAFVPERLSLSAQPTAVSWPQFRGDARLSGVAAGDLPASPTLKWTYEA